MRVEQIIKTPVLANFVKRSVPALVDDNAPHEPVKTFWDLDAN